MSTKIEWTDATWNPIVGCSKISAGCENCYAETAAASARLQQFGQYQDVIDFEIDKSYGQVVGHQWNGKTVFVDSQLEKPLHWKKPRKIFVCSMGDLFHESVPFEWIDKVMAIIALCHWHTFQILTKRPERMLEYFGRKNLEEIVAENIRLPQWFNRNVKEPLPSHLDFNAISKKTHFPLPNLWLGVTAENQEMADERIPLLLQIPAAKRFISIEPCLGDVNLEEYLTPLGSETCHYGTSHVLKTCDCRHEYINWVIVGCEAGAKRRDCKRHWISGIVMQCETAGVPVFVKQVSNVFKKVIKTIEQFPEELRIREFPDREALE